MGRLEGELLDQSSKLGRRRAEGGEDGGVVREELDGFGIVPVQERMSSSSRIARSVSGSGRSAAEEGMALAGRRKLPGNSSQLPLDCLHLGAEAFQIDRRVFPCANPVFQMLRVACDVFCPQRGARSLEGMRDIARGREVAGGEMRRQLVHVAEVRFDKPAQQREVFDRIAAQGRETSLNAHSWQRIQPFKMNVGMLRTRGPRR